MGMIDSGKLRDMTPYERENYFSPEERTRRWEKEEAEYAARDIDSLEEELAQNKAHEAELSAELGGISGKEIAKLDGTERYRKASIVMERVTLMMIQMSLNRHIGIKNGKLTPC